MADWNILLQFLYGFIHEDVARKNGMLNDLFSRTLNYQGPDLLTGPRLFMFVWVIVSLVVWLARMTPYAREVFWVADRIILNTIYTTLTLLLFYFGC